MRHFLFFWAIGLVGLLLLNTACTAENEEDRLPPDENGDELCYEGSIDFDKHIQPILDAQCLLCHAPSQGLGGVIIEREEDLAVYARSGILEEVLFDLPASDPRKMPPGTELSACDKEKFRDWIKAVNDED